MQMQPLYEWINLFNSADINQTLFPLQSVIKKLIKAPKKTSKTNQPQKKKLPLEEKRLLNTSQFHLKPNWYSYYYFSYLKLEESLKNSVH